ncbi:unnamed protein product [Thelazia callipaeda]|uniref:Uncharacterized protein n=1 Tax=Thelazia callipaeda TaxID=103827 RepID=A0A0N5CQX2_THECL|nr:unnamed protein product [Thelazia callipaeda]
MSTSQNFRRDSIRSANVVNEKFSKEMNTRRNIRRNGTIPYIAKGFLIYFLTKRFVETYESFSIYI